MRNSGNIQELVKLSPDFIGFIFYGKSKRFVTDFPKVSIPKSIKKVGVFVNETIENVIDLVLKNELDAVQLHGDETPEFCKELNRLVAERSRSDSKLYPKVVSIPINHPIQIIKAFSIDENFDFSATKEYEQYCDLFIFDTKGKGYGGTGLKYDWSILKNYIGETPFLLSGGIGENDAQSILSFLRKQESNQCIGVDLNSGFEDLPGVKNIEKLQVFKRQLKV